MQFVRTIVAFFLLALPALANPFEIGLPEISAKAISSSFVVTMPEVSARTISSEFVISLPAISAQTIDTGFTISLPEISAATISTAFEISLGEISARTSAVNKIEKPDSEPPVENDTDPGEEQLSLPRTGVENASWCDRYAKFVLEQNKNALGNHPNLGLGGVSVAHIKQFVKQNLQLSEDNCRVLIQAEN